MWNERLSVFLKSYFNTERDGRIVFKTMHSIRTIGRDRSRSSKMDIGYTSLILYQCRTQAAMLGLFGNYICSRRMFFFRIIARATTPIFLLSLLTITSYAFIFSLIAPFQINSFFPANPLISQSSSVGVPLKARLSGKYHTLPPPPPLSIILRKSFINIVYTPLNPPSSISPSLIILLT